jgi:hypothetical protein
MIVRRRTVLAFLLAGLAAVILVSPKTAKTQDQSQVQRDFIVMHDFAHDVSLPLREYPYQPVRPNQLRQMPEFPDPVRPFKAFEPDPVLQNLADHPQRMVGATIGLNFDGISNTGFVPPDTNASVGSTQVVETVNTSYQVFNKATGASVFGPVDMGTIFSGFSNCAADGNLSDPVVLYDKAANRWVISILAFNGSFSQNDECVAVSKTSDATGAYNRYDFNFHGDLPDYQKTAVWSDAYYSSYNIFPGGGFFTGAEVCAFDRSKMLTGASATSICFKRTASDFSFLPSDLDGATPPPAGRPDFFLELDQTSFTKLDLFQFHVASFSPPSATFTGPTQITIPVWSQLCGGSRSCISEPPGGEKVDSLGDRLMHRFAYRNFAGHERLVATHSVDTGGSIAGVRWYLLARPMSPVLAQSGTIKEGTNTSIWMGSIGQDKVGDIAVGFSESSTSIKPSVQFTGRIHSDPLGTMESIATIVAGTGVQTFGFNRWGDYSSMSIDPSDDCTFWYAQEYYKTSGFGTWNTRLANFKFTNCH